MNANHAEAQSESRLRIYLKAAVFALPAILVAQFVNLFLLPKLTYIQANAGLSDSQIYGTMNLARFLAHNGSLMVLIFISGVLLMEWRFQLWARYRKAALAASVFVVNTTVLVALTSIIMASVLMAPALLSK